MHCNARCELSCPLMIRSTQMYVNARYKQPHCSHQTPIQHDCMQLCKQAKASWVYATCLRQNERWSTPLDLNFWVGYKDVSQGDTSFGLGLLEGDRALLVSPKSEYRFSPLNKLWMCTKVELWHIMETNKEQKVYYGLKHSFSCHAFGKKQQHVTYDKTEMSASVEQGRKFQLHCTIESHMMCVFQ